MLQPFRSSRRMRACHQGLGGMDFRRLPICILSFDRVAYLRQTLDSLRTAMALAGMTGPVLLFQDGIHNRFSRQDKTTPEAVAACIAAFRDLMPQGVVFAAAENLGIGRNFDRAERWAFEAEAYPAALFFEDDMTVSPRYFLVMEQLYALALAQPRIAMFSAYGADGLADVRRQFEQRARVGAMHHNWAFGMTRPAWQQRETLTRDYMALLAGCDYRDRPLDRIAAWYGTLGWPPLPTSQDMAKSVALNTLGLARIASVAICARNLGEFGQHYTPAEFARLGFANVALLESAYPDAAWVFDPLDAAEIDAIVQDQRAAALQARLGAEAFAACSGLIESLRIMRAVGGEALLRGGRNRYVTHASGLYEDRWCLPRATLAFADSVALRGIEIEGIAAQHLPPGSRIGFALNGQQVLDVDVTAGQPFAAVLPMPRHLDGLEKRLVATCSVNLDPYSVGYNQDRRPLSFLLVRIVLLERDGTQTVMPGEALVEGAGAC
jgi:hypothetical protein